MNKTFSSIDEIHDYLLTDAEDEANQVLSREVGESESVLYGAKGGGRIFRADPIRSNRGGLCLSLEEGFTRSLSPEQVDRLHEIGLAAIRKALVDNQEQFVGVIIGETRNGRNYFDRFRPGFQDTLF